MKDLEKMTTDELVALRKKAYDILLSRDHHLTYAYDRHQRYKKTMRGKLVIMYHQMKKRNQNEVKKGRKNFNELDFTPEEYINHMLKNTKYPEIYKIWSGNSYENSCTPTTDRINNMLGYTLNNIQCLSWKGNRTKWDYCEGNLQK